MGDSEDEYDRKRRDKFRGERAEASYRGPDRPVRPRDDWPERDAWQRPRPRDYGGRVREHGYSPNYEPAAKRMRGDYFGDNYYNHYQPYHQPPHREQPPQVPAEGQQPPMMSFKAFLATQDDNISDNEAIEKYNDYKLEFQRQQLNEFFVAHKDDEWFRMKYHPDDSVKRKDELNNFIKKRLDVFLELFNAGKFDEYSLDHGHDAELVKLLDTIVIKLEDGTEEDMALLEEQYQDSIKYKTNHLNRIDPSDKKDIEEVIPLKDETVNLVNQEDTEVAVTNDTNNEENKTNGQEKMEEDNTDPEEKEKEMEANSEKADEENENKSEQGEDSEMKDEKPEENDKEMEEGEEKTQDKISAEATAEKPAKAPKEKRKRSYSGSSSSSSSSSSSDSEDEKKDDKPEKTEKEKEPEPVEIKPKPEEKPRPRFIYKTTSICLRNLAPTITKQEIESMCSRYDGFLRLALAEPQADRRWLRRGWLTFRRDSNIKEICWHFNNIRLRDFDLGAIINKDLSKRIRYVSGITAHKQVVRSDIRIAAKVILHLDNKSGLWSSEEDKPEDNFGLMSNNPVLHNITDYLIEECSAEEEELLGLEPVADNSDAATSVVERDNELIKVLDRIIMYLRIVHSIDYYNHSEYPCEDEMPSRCGLLHARGPAPTSMTEIAQYIGAAVESKMASYLPEKPQKEEQLKNEAKLVSISLKDIDTEIDKFVQANTRELAKDKWLCPLSGKKFKGPDFVRKHIFNKHAEKIEEVKKEVEFFNNYLKDKKRPMLPEQQPVKREEPPPYAHQSFRNFGGSYGGYGGYGGPARFNMYAQRQRGYAPRSRGGGMDHRPVVHYRDLDAPREPEEFI